MILGQAVMSLWRKKHSIEHHSGNIVKDSVIHEVEKWCTYDSHMHCGSRHGVHTHNVVRGKVLSAHRVVDMVRETLMEKHES